MGRKLGGRLLGGVDPAQSPLRTKPRFPVVSHTQDAPWVLAALAINAARFQPLRPGLPRFWYWLTSQLENPTENALHPLALSGFGPSPLAHRKSCVRSKDIGSTNTGFK